MRPATNPPKPNIAAWPKLTWPRYPPSQFQARAVAIASNVSVSWLCQYRLPWTSGRMARIAAAATTAMRARGRTHGGRMRFIPARAARTDHRHSHQRAAVRVLRHGPDRLAEVRAREQQVKRQQDQQRERKDRQPVHGEEGACERDRSRRVRGADGLVVAGEEQICGVAEHQP